jgi:hypothetical protein
MISLLLLLLAIIVWRYTQTADGRFILTPCFFAAVPEITVMSDITTGYIWFLCF